MQSYRDPELRTAFNDDQPVERHRKCLKMLVVLPSSLVRFFFEPTVANIVSCLPDVMPKKLLAGLKYVFLLGGFSSSPRIKAATLAGLEGRGYAVIAALRPA